MGGAFTYPQMVPLVLTTTAILRNTNPGHQPALPGRPAPPPALRAAPAAPPRSPAQPKSAGPRKMDRVGISKIGVLLALKIKKKKGNLPSLRFLFLWLPRKPTQGPVFRGHCEVALSFKPRSNAKEETQRITNPNGAGPQDLDHPKDLQARSYHGG